MALAQFAGQTVAAAAITDVWEAVRGRFARLLGRGDARKTEVAERWLAQTRAAADAPAGSELEQARQAAGGAVGGPVRGPAGRGPRRRGGASRAGGGGRGPAARGGGVGGGSFGGGRAGCEHHRVGRGDRGRGDPRERGAAGPYAAGSGAASSRTRGVEPGPGSVAADRGGTAIGTLEYQRRPEAASLPVRLAPRPVFLAGREGLLAELDARLAGGPEQPGRGWWCCAGWAARARPAWRWSTRTGTWPRWGCAGSSRPRTRRCWRRSSRVLAAQLGARELVDARDPVASVHAVLARARGRVAGGVRQRAGPGVGGGVRAARRARAGC